MRILIDLTMTITKMSHTIYRIIGSVMLFTSGGLLGLYGYLSTVTHP